MSTSLKARDTLKPEKKSTTLQATDRTWQSPLLSKLQDKTWHTSPPLSKLDTKPGKVHLSQGQKQNHCKVHHSQSQRQNLAKFTTLKVRDKTWQSPTLLMLEIKPSKIHHSQGQRQNLAKFTLSDKTLQSSPLSGRQRKKD